jgi:hypothetical protein
MSHVLEDKAVEAIIQGKKNLFFSLLGDLPVLIPLMNFHLNIHPNQKPPWP